jgi:hypothetical protein
MELCLERSAHLSWRSAVLSFCRLQMRTAELRTRSSHCSLAYLEREVLAKPMRMLCSSVQQCKCTNPARRLSLKQNKTRSPSSVPPSKVCAPRCLFVINQTIATRAHVCPSLQSGCQSLQRLGACGVQNLMLSEALSVCSLSPIAHMSATTACLLREPRAPVESVCSAAPLVQESLKARATVAVQQQHDSVSVPRMQEQAARAHAAAASAACWPAASASSTDSDACAAARASVLVPPPFGASSALASAAVGVGTKTAARANSDKTVEAVRLCTSHAAWLHTAIVQRGATHRE